MAVVGCPLSVLTFRWFCYFHGLRQAAQEFLKREEHERLTNMALWLDIIFSRYKLILEEILESQEDGIRVLEEEASIARRKRCINCLLCMSCLQAEIQSSHQCDFYFMLIDLNKCRIRSKRRLGRTSPLSGTIDSTDMALARANIVRMLQEATESRGGTQFDRIYPPYMVHDPEKQPPNVQS